MLLLDQNTFRLQSLQIFQAHISSVGYSDLPESFFHVSLFIFKVYFR